MQNFKQITMENRQKIKDNNRILQKNDKIVKKLLTDLNCCTTMIS